VLAGLNITIIIKLLPIAQAVEGPVLEVGLFDEDGLSGRGLPELRG